MGAGAVLEPYKSAPVFDGLADDPEGDSFKADMLRWLAWTSFKEPARQQARFGGALGSRLARFSMNVKRKWRKWRAASSCKPCRTCRTRRADWMPLMAIAALEPGCPQAEAAIQPCVGRKHPPFAHFAFVICAALPRQCRGRVARRALFSLLRGRAAL